MLNDLATAISDYHRALAAFVNGEPQPLDAVYSDSDDVTIANPFGPPRRGHPEVEEAFARAAAHYRDGEAVGFDQVSMYEAPELAYTVEIERYATKVGGSATSRP